MMPLYRQTSVFTSDKPNTLDLLAMDSDKGSFDDLEPAVTSPAPATNSSWKLLRKLFGESKSLSMNDATSKKMRRASCDQGSPSAERSSPTGLRKLSVSTKQRKTSTTKTPSYMKSRKYSAVNSQENLLHYFVTEADSSTLQKILQNKKVDINFMRPPGLSPLHTACVLGDLDVVELLVYHGASINLKTWSGLSPLQITSLFGHFDVAQFLIRSGASSRDIQDGCTGDAKLIQTVLSCM